MKLYTRSGDDGSTGLLGGVRVGKDSLRVEACGTVDELNCALGWAAVEAHHTELWPVLRQIQNHLFELGAELATAPNPEGGGASVSWVSRIGARQIQEVEKQIDSFWDALPPLRHFILPGGCELASRLHVARGVSRRAERLCVALSRQERVSADLGIYLNRLSDLLFAMARRANELTNTPELYWPPQDA